MGAARGGAQARGVQPPLETPARLHFACAQCGRPLPEDEGEAAGWRHGRLAAAGELDETSAPILLCPDCTEDTVGGAYDAGEGD